MPRTKSLVTLRNGINVIDTGALDWGKGGGTAGVLTTTLVRRQSRLNGTEGHARKILTDRRMEKELGIALSFSICSLVHINGFPPRIVIRAIIDYAILLSIHTEKKNCLNGLNLYCC